MFRGQGARRTRTHDGVRRGGARSDPIATADGYSPQLRDLVRLRHRLQRPAQQDHQRDADAKRQADRSRSRSDLRDLSLPHQDHRAHRQGRRARHRRDRRRHKGSRRRARDDRLLRCEPVGRDQKAVIGRKPRADQVDRRDAAAFDQRDARDQQGAGRPADALEERDQQPPAEPGGDPRREPDRSADGARQPQIFRIA